jgi:predicted phage terminase large subunit-like protein
MAKKKQITQAVEQAYEEEQVVLGPCSEKQRMVLTDNETDILLVGGGAGGGKSYLALLKALDFCQDPAARVLIVRLTYPVLKAVGGLVDESKFLYSQFGAEFKLQPLEWHFPNGAMVKFVAMPTDHGEVQGWQATNIIVDEGAEFKLEDILALKARIRGARYKGKLGMTITCNPNRNSWLFPFVEYCLDENGVPKAGTEYITRYFINRGGKILWGDTKDELFEKHGHGLNRDPEKGRVTFGPVSFRFIPMDIYSNPVLLKNNPDYLKDLLSGTRVAQLRFLHGSWTAVPEGNSNFNRDWVNIIEHAPVEVSGRVRSWDLAHSVPSETYPDPDWTAGVKMSRTKSGRYVVEHVKRDRRLTDGVVRMLIDTAHQEDGLGHPVTIPKDNGGGKAATQFFIKALAEQGITVKGIPISGHTTKMQRFLPFCSIAEAGLVDVVRGEWNDDFFVELEFFQGIRNEKNDQVDACADAFNFLAKGSNIPDFVVPDLSGPSPVPTI